MMRFARDSDGSRDHEGLRVARPAALSLSRVQRAALTCLVVAVCVCGSASAASAKTGGTSCVGGKAGCYASIQAALDAAQDGDTIDVGVGTFQGGITITKSV